MTFVEMEAMPEEETQRQRWSHYLTIGFCLLAFAIGVNLRDSTINATTLYTNTAAGIQAAYPQNWLIDSDGDYVFRVRDVSAPGFKTVIQVDVRPVSANTAERNLLDALSLGRAQTLAAYNPSPFERTLLPNEIEATQMRYTFVAMEANPFLEGIPVTVRGVDILTLTRGQAIIITFQSDATTYGQNAAIFEHFLNSLEFWGEKKLLSGKTRSSAIR